MSKLYPLMINIQNKNCLIIGGGKVALRKINTLVNYTSNITVISNTICNEISDLVKSNCIKWMNKTFEPDDLNNAYLVYAATNDKTVNKLISEEANKRNILVNNVSDPDLCTFTVPSIVQRGDLTISISTNGKSPLLSKIIRQEIEQLYDDHYEILVDILGKTRVKALKEINSDEKRELFFNEIIDLNLLSLIKSNKNEVIQEKIDKLFDKFRD